MDLFKDDGLNLDENALDGFGEDSIDKDLLNQIFADDGSNGADSAQLDIDGEDFYIDTDNGGNGTLVQGNTDKNDANPEKTVTETDKTGSPVKEETKAENQAATEEPGSKAEDTHTGDIAAEPEDNHAVAEEDKTQEEAATEKETSKASPSSVNDNIVDEEAMKAMNEERLKGTVTVITENTTITGSISSDGSLEVRGTITGDIECVGKVYINGVVSGGVVASEIYVNTPKLTGGLLSDGTVKIGVGTIVLGDVSGSSAYIAGAVKGNIDIDGPVVIESTAIIKGDIKAKSITLNQGAVVEGYCSLYYTGVDLDKFFEEE